VCRLARPARVVLPAFVIKRPSRLLYIYINYMHRRYLKTSKRAAYRTSRCLAGVSSPRGRIICARQARGECCELSRAASKARRVADCGRHAAPSPSASIVSTRRLPTQCTTTMVHARLNETESNPNPHINFITALPIPDSTERESARQLLRALAAQVKPIMKSHGFTVNSFEEVRVFSRT
jgi:hypothetical protein